MYKTIAFLAFLAFRGNCLSALTPRWEYITPYELVLLQPNPDGFDASSNTTTFLCRLYGDGGRWIAGSLYLEKERSVCVAVAYRSQLVSNTFQVLLAKPGTTSWVPHNGTIPENAIEAGSHRSGAPLYACRVPSTDGLTLHIGAAWGDVCAVADGSGETWFRSSIEVLALNHYGVLLESQ